MPKSPGSGRVGVFELDSSVSEDVLSDVELFC